MFRQCLELMKCSAIGGTNIPRKIVTVSCVVDGGCKQLDGQMQCLDHVRCFRPMDVHTTRWTYAMDYVRDSRRIDGHIGQWAYAMDFVRDSGCYHSRAAPIGFANRICSHIADRICEPICSPRRYQEYWSATGAGQHPPEMRTGFAATLRTRFTNRICGPGRFQYWSTTAAGQHPPDLRTGFAATLRTGFANRSALEGSSIGVLPQRGSTHRICEPDLQPHCGPVL
jgi:hypothetical protein